MTHRERVLAALAHEEPDSVPLDLGSTRDSSIVLRGYGRLKQHLGVEAPDILTSRMMQTVIVDEQILQALDIDTRGIYPGEPPPDIPDESRYRDEWGVERVQPPGGLYFDQVDFPLSGDIEIADVARYPWPDPDAPIRTEGLKEQVRNMREQTDSALVLNLPSGFVHTSQYLRGFEDWFMDFAANPKLLAALFDAVLEVNLAICRNLLREVGDQVDVVLASDDLGLQGSLMMPPAAYRELIKPRHARYFGLMHEMSPAKVLFHTCGSVIDIIDDLIETGVDVLHPVQVSAAGMEPRALKEKWGDRLSFWGGIDTQHLLPHGSAAEVQAGVERLIEQLGRDGGFVLGAVHNIQPDVPLANMLTMFRHARAYQPSFRAV